MKIIIAGAGEVGTHLAKLLSKEEQDIVLIDSDESKLSNMDSNYNLMTVTGNPTSFKVLSAAGVSSADLFIAVTPSETSNITACTMASNFGAKKTLARIDNYEYLLPENQKFFKSIGVNSMIYPEELAAEEISTALKRPWVRSWFELYNGKLILIGVKLRKNASLIGTKLMTLSTSDHYFHISAIKRKNETIIPRGDDTIIENDIVYFTTTPDHVDTIRTLSGKLDYQIKKVMIMGGSRIAMRLVNLTHDWLKIKIVESDLQKSYRLSEKMPNVSIINGDGRDPDLLTEEGIDEIDAFISLTDSSETNILSCLSAKQLGGVPKTIAEVENIQYISEAEGLNIGTVINKKLLASSKIFQILLDADATNAKCLALADAEVAELVAKPGSKIVSAPVKDLHLNRDMTIAGLIRDNQGMLVQGNTQILPGDHVLIICLSGAIHKVEKIFS